MRDYDLMRNILITTSLSTAPLELCDFLNLAEPQEIKEELTRLKDEGLLNSTFTFDVFISHGKVQGLTKEGTCFLRDIKDEKIWMLVKKTLKAASLDISYPLLKEICEVVIKKYVMSKIPKEIE